MGFFNLFRRGSAQPPPVMNYVIDLKNDEELKELVAKWNSLAEYNFALHVAADKIAQLIAKCEIRTYSGYKPLKGDLYYKLNFQPNPNQNASAFWTGIIRQLIFESSCLVVQDNEGNFYVADHSYIRTARVFYPDMYQQVTITREGESFRFARTFYESDVLLFEIDNRQLRHLVQTLAEDLEALRVAAEQRFFKAGGEKGVLKIEATAPNQNYGKKADGTPRTFNEVFAEMMNKQFKNYFENPNAVMPLFSGFDYKPTISEGSKKSTSEIKDVLDVSSEITKKVAMALQIPVQLLTGDVSDTEQIINDAMTCAVDPLITMRDRELNRKLFRREEIAAGTCLKTDSTVMTHIEIFRSAPATEKLLQNGLYNVDDVRWKLGEMPLGTKDSQAYYRTKNAEEAGGETNGREENT